MVAGVLGGAVYIAEMAIDRRIVGYNTDDLVLLGRPFVHNPIWNRRLGATIHLSNSAVFGLAYAAVQDRLPGPPWLRGVLFANVENVALYPLTRLDRYHPGVREGQIARYWNRTAFLQSIPRHIVFGAVLGEVYARLRRD